MFRRYLKSTSGQGMSEYLILVLLIAVGSIAAAESVGKVVYSKLDQVHKKLQDVNFTDVQGGDSSGSSSGGSRGGGRGRSSGSGSGNSSGSGLGGMLGGLLGG